VLSARPPSAALRNALDALAARYDRRWLESDPLRWPRRYASPRDQEVVAVVAALLAYGRVASIDRSVAAALAALGAHPSDALAPSRRRRLPERLRGFRHRFTSGDDLAWLLASVGRAWDEAGSLGAFVGAHALGAEPLRAGLLAWHRLAAGVDAETAQAASVDATRRRARRFLLADPASGSACKRSLLLARWCVREDDGLDLGLWAGRGLRPRDLLVPLDTHVHRVAAHVGLTRRPRADWQAAVEVTAGLSSLCPDDPVRYDFALARPGIVGRCRHRLVVDVCSACDLAACCRHGRRLPAIALTT
jgi:uncharacterized protein (TIGR02757 family)